MPFEQAKVSLEGQFGSQCVYSFRSMYHSQLPVAIWLFLLVEVRYARPAALTPLRLLDSFERYTMADSKLSPAEPKSKRSRILAPKDTEEDFIIVIVIIIAITITIIIISTIMIVMFITMFMMMMMTMLMVMFTFVFMLMLMLCGC